MATTLRIILAVGEIEERVKLKSAFLSTPDMEIVAETGEGEDVVRLAKENKPEIIIIDAVLEGEVTDGLSVAEEAAIQVPSADIVMISDQGTDGLFLRKAMLAGVRQVLPKPFEPTDLVEVIRLVSEITIRKREALAAVTGASLDAVHSSKMVTVFSTKGGVGRTLLATNLAIGLRRMTGKKVALVDLDLQFGDVAIMLHLKPKNTIAGLAREVADLGVLDDEVLQNYLIEHEESGLMVLPAPVRPDEADLVKGNHVDMILRKLSEKFHYVVVDTPSYLSDTVLTALELSEAILLLLTMELPTLKDGKLMMEIMQTFGYTGEKVRLVLNREDPNAPFKKTDIEETLEVKVTSTLPSDGLNVLQAVNEGEPVFLRASDSKYTGAIRSMVNLLAEGDVSGEEEAEAGGEETQGFFAKLFGGGKKATPESAAGEGEGAGEAPATA